MADDDYDPHLHRNRPYPTSNLETLFHLLKSAIGTGILAMPEAYMHCGFISGTVLTCLLSVILTWCLNLLVKAEYKMCKQMKVPLIKYPQAMQIALEMGPKCMRGFGKYMPRVVDGFLLVNQIGNSCVYVVFVAENFKMVIDQYLEYPLRVEFYILTVCFVPCGLMLSVRNLKWLAPFSLIATLISFVTIGVVVYYVSDLPSITQRTNWGTFSKYPLFFGTVIFAVSSIGVFVSVENNMKTPQDFLGYCGVLNIAMVIITMPYILVGFMGYWKFGDDTKGSITLNFPPDEMLAQVINILYSISIIISYGLQAYVAFEIIWNYYEEPASAQPYSIAWEYLLRTWVLIFTVILASVAPFLGLIISLVGALCISALAIVFPALADMCVNWENEKGRVCMIIIDVLIMLFGLAGLVAGTYTSLYGIIVASQEHSKDPDTKMGRLYYIYR